MFFHVMVDQNPKQSNAKQINFFHFIRWDVKIYLHKEKYVTSYLKNENIIEK